MSTTDLPELNPGLMDEVMGRIRAEPENWNQRIWACGTQRCFAGHAVEIAGAQLLMDYPSSFASWCERPDGGLVSIHDYARDLLGLTEEEAEFLFNSSTVTRTTMPVTPDEMQERVKQIIDGRST